MIRTSASLLGLYNFDPDLFSEVVFPDQLDRDDIIDNIVLECAEMEVVYPDADFLKSAMGIWSRSRLLTWQRMADVLTEEYDPFVNIKRDEVRTITETRDLKDTGNGTQTEQTNAYNAGTGTERGKTITNTSGTNTGTVKTEEHFHVEGDSAITDAQDVMKKEIEVRSLYDIYKLIITDFKRRFCLLVY